MGFFGRSKKVKKDSPALAAAAAAKDPRWASPPPRYGHNGHTKPLPPPPPSPPPPSSHAPPPSWYPGSPYQSQVPFQPAGLLPPPPSWSGASPTPNQYPPPIIVNQHHYYLTPRPDNNSVQAPTPRHPQTSTGALSKLNLGSMVDLAGEVCQGVGIPQLFDDGLSSLHGYKTQVLNQGAALCDQINQISGRFNDVLTSIDLDHYKGNERELFGWRAGQVSAQTTASSNAHSTSGTKSVPSKTSHKKGHSSSKEHPKGQTSAVAATVISGSYFSKVELYANSKLPLDLPPLRLYIPTYPLLCLAAQYSERVYERPRGAERDVHVDADWRTGTKAMVIKSMPMDYMNTIVFAIRGTATFMDWAVNLNAAPASPAGFLDDPSNFCHSGFLSVARKMISPVARRLRQLLEEDPSRASYSLLITGHSAGGAVAALLYSHMLATSKAAESELNILTGCFKRVHCITFGTPPVSLVPLTKPDDFDRRPQLKKSLFLSFLNEGDPVARADKAYIKSLLELFATPSPSTISSSGRRGSSSSVGSEAKKKGSSKEGKSSSKTSVGSTKTGGKSTTSKESSTSNNNSLAPIWKLPPCTLSSAGRIVVLRSGDPKARMKSKKTVEDRLNEGVVAHIATDEQLRDVIWGDPVCHVMKLYAGRIETLAVGAVTARGY